MKAHLHPITATLSLIAITSCLAPSLNAQTDRRPASTVPATDLTNGVYIASIDVADHGLRRYQGDKLLNSEGAELGSVRDFVVDPASSRVRYMVVSTGGVLGGMGNSLRLVPMEAVSRGRAANTLVVDILQSQWLQIPPVHDEDYIADRFNISAAQHGELVRRFGSASSNVRTSPTTSTAVATTGEVLGLIRASALRGRAVTAGQSRIGKVENIIFDVDRGTAAALIDSDGDFTGTTGKYLVPLNRLALTAASQPLTTTLTRADFDRATPSNLGPAINAAAPPIRTDEPPLTPTGRANANDRPLPR
jgi:sporulation protein YlmC with PRC-barrel domain